MCYKCFRIYRLTHNACIFTNENCLYTGAGLGGCQEGPLPPKILPGPPSGPPKFFRSLSESPTQTIDSSPCCKTSPSSGPPKWKCLAPPLPLYLYCVAHLQYLNSFHVRMIWITINVSMLVWYDGILKISVCILCCSPWRWETSWLYSSFGF